MNSTGAEPRGTPVPERVEHLTRTISGKRWEITITRRHNPIAHRDAQAMFIGMIVQQLMDEMLKRVDGHEPAETS